MEVWTISPRRKRYTETIKVMGFRESHGHQRWGFNEYCEHDVVWRCLKVTLSDSKAACMHFVGAFEKLRFSLCQDEIECGKCFCPENATGKTLHLSNRLTFCKCPNWNRIDFWNRIAKHVQYSMMISFMCRWHEGTLHIKCNEIERRHMKNVRHAVVTGADSIGTCLHVTHG